MLLLLLIRHLLLLLLVRLEPLLVLLGLRLLRARSIVESGGGADHGGSRMRERVGRNGLRAVGAFLDSWEWWVKPKIRSLSWIKTTLNNKLRGAELILELMNVTLMILGGT